MHISNYAIVNAAQQSNDVFVGLAAAAASTSIFEAHLLIQTRFCRQLPQSSLAPATGASLRQGSLSEF